MQITMSSTEAFKLIARSYADQSKPLSINTRPADAQPLDWWPARGKSGSVEQARKSAALHPYLHIASWAEEAMPANTFPAAFLFNDRAQYRPDKGLIKALLQGQEINGELCFVLTASGQKNLRN